MLRRVADRRQLYTVPLFLIVVRQLTATQASSRLIIAPLLQAVGALLTGFWIKRYGYYKYPGMVGEIVTLMGSIGLCFWSKDSPESVHFLTSTTQTAKGPGIFSGGRTHCAVWRWASSSLRRTWLSQPAWVQAEAPLSSHVRLCDTRLHVAQTLIKIVIWMGRLAGQVVGIAISGIVIQFTLRSELPKRITDPNSINVRSASCL